MRLINRFYLHGLYPLLEKGGSGLARRMERFEKWEQLKPSESANRQWARLIRLLQHAYDSSPFYKKRFDQANFNPKRTFDASDLKSIPLLTRDDIRVHLTEMCSRAYRVEELSVSATGGTTDTPVKFYRDANSVTQKIALQWQLSTWAGMYPGDKVFYLWGARSDYAANPSWRWSIYDQHLMRRRWAPTSVMTAEVAEKYREDINRFKPRVIYAYPTPLAIFCEFIQQSGKPLHSAVAAICTAESLLDTQRVVIERALGCPIFTLYGAREFGMIGAECEQHAGIHFAAPGAYVEFIPVPDAEEQNLCEMVVTDLLNYGMPLIRYRVNDCGIPGGSCPCGRSYALARAVLGRTGDIFQLPDGSKVPGVALTNRVLQVCPNLKKIQIVQNTIADFTVKYVPWQRETNDGIAVLRENLRKFFPPEVRWTFEQVEDIGREASGKTRFCISKLQASEGALSSTRG